MLPRPSGHGRAAARRSIAIAAIERRTHAASGTATTIAMTFFMPLRRTTAAADASVRELQRRRGFVPRFGGDFPRHPQRHGRAVAGDAVDPMVVGAARGAGVRENRRPAPGARALVLPRHPL